MKPHRVFRIEDEKATVVVMRISTQMYSVRLYPHWRSKQQIAKALASDFEPLRMEFGTMDHHISSKGRRTVKVRGRKRAIDQALAWMGLQRA